jgi:hypothetical protein
MIQYRGQQRDGTSATGVIERDLLHEVQKRYEQGWLWAEFERDGYVVGRVWAPGPGPLRSWWSETQ